MYSNDFNNKFNSGNLIKDRIDFELYSKATGLDQHIKYNDNVGFKQFQDLLLNKKGGK